MSALLRAIAGLPQVGGPLPVRVLPDGLSDGFRIIRTGNPSVVDVAALHDGSDRGRHEAEAYARMVSGTPVMLDLLATVLVRLGQRGRERHGDQRRRRRGLVGRVYDGGTRRAEVDHQSDVVGHDVAGHKAMRRGVSLAELIRQDVLDLDPEPPRLPYPIPPRLLILACSATKATGEGLVARERYQGPLWQTLRKADPDGSKAFVCFLSAKFGLGDARSLLPPYDRVLTDAGADRMMSANAWASYPELPQNSRMSNAAKLRAASRHGPQRTPSYVLRLLELELGQPFRDVAICGGHRYVRVACSWLPDFRIMRQIAADGPVTVINSPIGTMRARLRAWLTGQPRSKG